MRFALTDDQAAIRNAVRELLARECPPELVRAAWPGGDPDRVDRLWSRLAELGLPGAGVPEPAGGLGLDGSGLVPVLTELGYAAVPLPAAETAAVAGPLLAAAGDARLGSLVGGARVALVGPSGLTPYGQRADLLLAITPDRATLAEPPAAAVPVPTVDGSRAALRVGELAGTVVTTDRALLALTADRVTLAAAAQLVGLGHRLCDLTVDYVRQRHQFGVPVGSFQAVKHQLANLALRLALAEPAVQAAGWSLARRAAGAPDVAVAGLLATEAATLAARTAIQCHGAIGYTVEYDLHLYAKRVWALAAADRGIDHHLERVATALDLPEGARP